MKRLVKRFLRVLPMPAELKNKIYFKLKSYSEKYTENKTSVTVNSHADLSEYVKQVLMIPTEKSLDYVSFCIHDTVETDFSVIAYYLTQFHPNAKNDEWWGKGTTEWTNVSKAVPQYVGHYQPRLPGELGYYDLRIKENMAEQIRLARNYGIKAFCFYYYWFDGERLLEEPLNMFLENKDLDINFCISWANENWTKRFSGTNTDVLMQIGETEESNIRFIYDVLPMLKDERYYRINGKPLLIVYRPMNIKNIRTVFEAWRKIAKEEAEIDLYIVATQEKDDVTDWCAVSGCDAETEFQPKTLLPHLKEVTNDFLAAAATFRGTIYSYEDAVEKATDIAKRNVEKKIYPAVMPMWDNTARRNNRGVIFHGANPDLYKRWLLSAHERVKQNGCDQKIVFINAWNEWGEGAYLEPDRFFGYAFLEKTYEAMKETADNYVIDKKEDK